MVIPASVWESDLSDKTILLYGHIATLANKNGYAYASDSYFEKALKTSKRTIQYKLKELDDAGVIKRTVIYNEDKKTIKERRIYLTSPAIDDNITRPIDGDITRAIDTSVLDNTINNNTTSNNIIDDDILGKIFFKIVELYPKNRVGNRQHGLKKFKQLDIDQAKLAARNLNRYLKIAGQYVKSLQNYIDQECYSEAWLSAEEKTKQKQNSITGNKTKIFSGNYDDLD